MLPSHLSIQQTKDKGRSVFARKDIPAQSTVLIVYPFVALPFLPYRKRFCGHCLLYDNKCAGLSYRCSGSETYYCSEKCKDNDSSHEKICEPLRKVSSWMNRGGRGKNSKCHPGEIIRLMVVILAQISTCGVASRYDPLLAEALNMNKGEVLNVTAPTGSLEDVFSLESHYDEWITEDQQEWSRIARTFIIPLLKEFNLLPDNWKEKDVLDLVSRIESNGFGIYDGRDDIYQEPDLEPEGIQVNMPPSPPQSPIHSSKKKETTIGRSIYPSASYFNHSCSPVLRHGKQMNAYRRVDQRLVGLYRPLIFTTDAQVNSGTEMTITYIDDGPDRPTCARRRELRENYYFECGCERCN